MKQHDPSLAGELSRTRAELRAAHALIRALQCEIRELQSEEGEQDDLPELEAGD